MGLTRAYEGLFFDHELKLFQKYRHLAYYGKNRRIRKKNMKKANETAGLPRFRSSVKKLLQSEPDYIYPYL